MMTVWDHLASLKNVNSIVLKGRLNAGGKFENVVISVMEFRSSSSLWPILVTENLLPNHCFQSPFFSVAWMNWGSNTPNISYKLADSPYPYR